MVAEFTEYQVLFIHYLDSSVCGPYSNDLTNFHVQTLKQIRNPSARNVIRQPISRLVEVRRSGRYTSWEVEKTLVSYMHANPLKGVANAETAHYTS
jgi:hypothetical protein